MELRILINQGREQFTGISGHDFCHFKNGIQDKFPYFVRYGQFESVPGGLIKEFTERFIGFKPFDRTQYIVLHHGQCNTGYLCGEVNRLTFPKSEQSLFIAIGYFSGPSHGVNPVGSEKTETQVCSQQSVPLSLTPSLTEEQTDCSPGKLHVNGQISALERSIILAELPACLRGIGIIYNQTDRLFMRRHGLPADFPEQLKVHCIKQTTPLDIVIIYKTIEHVLLTQKLPAQ